MNIVIGSERSIDEAREEEAAGRRERCAVIGIRLVDLLLELAGKGIDDDDVGFIALDIIVHASQYDPVGIPAGIRIEG